MTVLYFFSNFAFRSNYYTKPVCHSFSFFQIGNHDQVLSSHPTKHFQVNVRTKIRPSYIYIIKLMIKSKNTLNKILRTRSNFCPNIRVKVLIIHLIATQRICCSNFETGEPQHLRMLSNNPDLMMSYQH